MRRLVFAAALATIVGVTPSQAAFLGMPFNCATGTSCSTAATAIPPSENLDFSDVKSFGCEWSSATVLRVEAIILAGDGITVVQKVYFPVQAHEKAGRSLATVRLDTVLIDDSLALNPGQLLKITIVSSKSGANSGTCYIQRSGS